MCIIGNTAVCRCWGSWWSNWTHTPSLLPTLLISSIRVTQLLCLCCSLSVSILKPWLFPLNHTRLVLFGTSHDHFHLIAHASFSLVQATSFLTMFAWDIIQRDKKNFTAPQEVLTWLTDSWTKVSCKICRGDNLEATSVIYCCALYADNACDAPPPPCGQSIFYRKSISFFPEIYDFTGSPEISTKFFFQLKVLKVTVVARQP